MGMIPDIDSVPWFLKLLLHRVRQTDKGNCFGTSSDHSGLYIIPQTTKLETLQLNVQAGIRLNRAHLEI